MKGRGALRERVKLREWNQALDLEVSALTALYILGPAPVRSLQERAVRLAAPVGGAIASLGGGAEARPFHPCTVAAIATWGRGGRLVQLKAVVTRY